MAVVPSLAVTQTRDRASAFAPPPIASRWVLLGLALVCFVAAVVIGLDPGGQPRGAVVRQPARLRLAQPQRRGAARRPARWTRRPTSSSCGPSRPATSGSTTACSSIGAAGGRPPSVLGLIGALVGLADDRAAYRAEPAVREPAAGAPGRRPVGSVGPAGDPRDRPGPAPARHRVARGAGGGRAGPGGDAGAHGPGRVSARGPGASATCRWAGCCWPCAGGGRLRGGRCRPCWPPPTVPTGAVASPAPCWPRRWRPRSRDVCCPSTAPPAWPCTSWCGPASTGDRAIGQVAVIDTAAVPDPRRAHRGGGRRRCGHLGGGRLGPAVGLGGVAGGRRWPWWWG